jgi:hypothetical protein
MANPTTNYSFQMPTSSDLVTDLPADFEIFGQAVDTQLKSLNPETTLGDISYRSSTANTKTRLAIGSTGQVLTVSGGVPAWATAATPNISWTAVNAGGTSLSGSTTTISGITGANQLMILYVGASSTATYIELYARINNDSGSNYLYGGLNQVGGTTNDMNSTTANKFVIAGGSASATASASGSLLITGGNSSGVKYVNGVSGQNGGSGNGAYSFGGYWNNTSTITEINFFFSAGTFDAGTVYVFKSA